MMVLLVEMKKIKESEKKKKWKENDEKKRKEKSLTNILKCYIKYRVKNKILHKIIS